MAQRDDLTRIRTRLQCRAEHFRSSPIHRKYRPRLSETKCPPPAWSKYYRLNDALTHARSSKDNLRVFAIEPALPVKSEGKREFVVASYKEFWFYYSKLNNDRRHFYEVIEEGAACHLYFDLEFSIPLNRGLDGERLVDQLIDATCKAIKSQFGVYCDKKNVLRLDSSTAIKFSQHLIFHIPKAAFRCNYDVGSFVRKTCRDPTLCSALTVRHDDDREGLIVDEGVYTKNRNFRLFMSSKKSKSVRLIRSSLCEFELADLDVGSTCCVFHCENAIQPSRVKRQKFAKADELEYIFYTSLITNVKFNEDLRILSCSESQNKLSFRNGQEQLRSVISITQSNNNRDDLVYPEIFNFLSDMVLGACAKGRVEQNVFFPCNQMIIYNVIGYRYCENIKRQHKSNHIYYIVDLKSHNYYQKCHDPVCRAKGFRSPPVPLPERLVTSLGFDSEMTDDELLEIVTMSESFNGADDDMFDEESESWDDVTDKDMLDAVLEYGN